MNTKERKRKNNMLVPTDCEYCGYPKKGYDHISCETEDMRGCHEVEFQHELAREGNAESQMEFERGN